LALPPRQNSAEFGEKLEALRNRKTVARWYKDSFLQDLRAWPL
jgi:hypothetical protein